MGTAVYLKYDVAVQAVKIDDEISDDLLAVKVVAAKLAFAELLPQEDLAQVAGAAQFTGTVTQEGVAGESEVGF